MGKRGREDFGREDFWRIFISLWREYLGYAEGREDTGEDFGREDTGEDFG